jgi:site-specific recombinase XerD
VRHSILTLAVENGVDLTTAAGMANHSGTATISRYLHARASRVDEARDKVRSIMQDVHPRTATREP